jgi:hypothetical protein
VKKKENKRKEWWLRRLDDIKLYGFSVLGVAVLLEAPNLREGIRGFKLYIPNWTEVGVALVLAYLALLFDEKSGERHIKSPKVMARKRKTAFIAGVGILALIQKIIGG